MRHYRLFGANLVLGARVRTQLGSNTLRIEDTITNQGFRAHALSDALPLQFGYPVVSPDTELWVETEQSWPRDDEAAGFDRHTRFEPPTPGYAEQVFFHQPAPDAEGYGRAALVNRALDFGAYVRFRLAELPHLIQWKMMGQGAYVVGLEPANCWVEGRNVDRRSGALQFLEPGQSLSTALEIGALPDASAIQAYLGG